MDLKTGQVLKFLQGVHRHFISSMVVTKDCEYLYSAGWDAVIHRISIADGKIVNSYGKVSGDATHGKIFLD